MNYTVDDNAKICFIGTSIRHYFWLAKDWRVKWESASIKS